MLMSHQNTDMYIDAGAAASMVGPAETSLYIDANDSSKQHHVQYIDAGDPLWSALAETRLPRTPPFSSKPCPQDSKPQSSELSPSLHRILILKSA